MRVRTVRGFGGAAAIGLLVAAVSCSSGSPAGPGEDGEISGRVAWSSPTARSEEIFVADVVITAPGKAAGPGGIEVRAAGPGVYTAVFEGRPLTIRAAVFTGGRAQRSAESAGFHATNVRQVTNNGYGDFAPAINPRDWDEVFYHSVRGKRLSVVRADVRTGVETVVIATGADPNIGADGQILFTNNGIWRYDPGAGQVTLVFDGRTDDPVPLQRGGELLIFFNSPTAWTGQPFAAKANFLLETGNGRVHKLTAMTVKEDNPVPSDDGTMVVWHAWLDGAAAIVSGRLEGYDVPAPARIAFHDADTGAPLVGNCWYASWVGPDRIMFHNEDRVFISDLQGNAHDTGLRGSEISLVD